jgi:hypothetical protein
MRVEEGARAVAEDAVRCDLCISLRVYHDYEGRD